MYEDKQNIIYNFLIHKRFKLYRHIFLVLAVATIVVSSYYTTFENLFYLLGNKIYGIIFFFLIIYLLVFYFNLFILVPKLLIKKQYLQYMLVLFLVVFVFVFINLGVEYLIFKLENIAFRPADTFYSSTNFILEFFKSFVINTIFILSVSMSGLFRSWQNNLIRVSQLEIENLQIELINIKDNINPSFLSRILKKSASLSLSSPQEASNILLKFSKILRYQLYDCGRDKVLLTSEINFLTNYLNLEKIFYPYFDFSINSDGDRTPVFIPPLLFFSFIQQFVTHIHTENRELLLKLHFMMKDHQLHFVCKTNGVDPIDCIDIIHRLDILYGNHYAIEVKDLKELRIQINI